jgi:hypothetical protein
MPPLWNTDPEIFSLGRFELRWYGLFFALGFFLGYKIMAQFYRSEGRNLADLSDLLLYLILGTIIGARLGHVLLYQPGYYLEHPWEILMLWQGGLASHGGFAGVMVALYFYVRRHRDMTFIELADRLTIPSLLAASLIRIGNFFNSEILGTPSNLPWAVVFARVDNIPRHPLEDYNHSISRESLRHGVDDLFSRSLHDRVRQRKPGALREAHAFEHGTTSEHSLYCGRCLPYLCFIKNASKDWKLKMSETRKVTTRQPIGTIWDSEQRSSSRASFTTCVAARYILRPQEFFV